MRLVFRLFDSLVDWEWYAHLWTCEDHQCIVLGDCHHFERWWNPAYRFRGAWLHKTATDAPLCGRLRLK